MGQKASPTGVAAALSASAPTRTQPACPSEGLREVTVGPLTSEEGGEAQPAPNGRARAPEGSSGAGERTHRPTPSGPRGVRGDPAHPVGRAAGCPSGRAGAVMAAGGACSQGASGPL